MRQRRRSLPRRGWRLRARGKPDRPLYHLRGFAQEAIAGDSARCASSSITRAFLYRQLPYIVVLVLAISGVAYANISHQPLVGYWEFLALAMGVVCVVTEWAKAARQAARWQLILRQALHWGAILVAMNIMLLAGVQQFMPAPATGSGASDVVGARYFSCWPQSVIPSDLLSGPAMALAVPAIAWLKQFALFLLLGAVLLGWAWR